MILKIYKPFFVSNKKMVKLIHVQGKKKLTLSQKATDWITKLIGSWFFIGIFVFFLICWISLNTFIWVRYEFGAKSFDPFPYSLLNLILAVLTASQVPIILMSQNREEERDRARFEYDYEVNRKAEREIEALKKQLDRIERKLK